MPRAFREDWDRQARASACDIKEVPRAGHGETKWDAPRCPAQSRLAAQGTPEPADGLRGGEGSRHHAEVLKSPEASLGGSCWRWRRRGNRGGSRPHQRRCPCWTLQTLSPKYLPPCAGAPLWLADPQGAQSTKMEMGAGGRGSQGETCAPWPRPGSSQVPQASSTVGSGLGQADLSPSRPSSRPA